MLLDRESLVLGVHGSNLIKLQSNLHILKVCNGRFFVTHDSKLTHLQCATLSESLLALPIPSISPGPQKRRTFSLQTMPIEEE